MENQENVPFDGVFKVTNASDLEFTFRWNNKDYVFPPMSTCPFIIPNHSLEEIQSIRKKLALKYAQREFDRSAKGIAVAIEGNKHFTPATYDLSVLQPYVDQCLNPLPIGTVTVVDVPPRDIVFRDNGSAIIGQSSLKEVSETFADYVPPQLGAMADSV